MRPLVQLVPGRANVELRQAPNGERVVVLAFPYDRRLVELVRSIPHRRFDWDTREWSAPAEDWAALKVTEILEHHPELTAEPAVHEWLASTRQRWIGSVSTRRHDDRGWLVLKTLAGPLPDALADVVVARQDELFAPLTRDVAQALRAERSARP